MSKISKSLQGVLFVVVASAVLTGGTVQALACQYAVRTSDNALMNTFPIPTFSTAKKFVMRQAADFVIVQASWTGHGLEAFDDPKTDYAKHWLSSYLLAEGNYFSITGQDSNGNPLLLDRAFHSAKDYYTMAKGEPEFDFASATHGRFLSLLGGTDPERLAVYSWSVHPPVAAIFFWPLAAFPEKTETVTTFCGLYDVNRHNVGPTSVYLPGTDNIYGTPSERASNLVHEAMHAHYRDVDALRHVNCSDGQPNSLGDCDRFYPHRKSDYAGDDLHWADSGSRKLPSYQVQHEYLCDLLDQAKDWVPLAVLSDAEGAAARLAKGKFVEAGGKRTPPPYDCGVPSPMMTRLAGAPGCGITACSAISPCSVGICDEGCCVVVK
ncbi:MAG TPA: hypothetical protein VJV79_37795 [Polyangiaceae bacterium]|nr:hypothetical protein [Polyangiaceae bacterium]